MTSAIMFITQQRNHLNFPNFTKKKVEKKGRHSIQSSHSTSDPIPNPPTLRKILIHIQAFPLSSFNVITDLLYSNIANSAQPRKCSISGHQTIFLVRGLHLTNVQEVVKPGTMEMEMEMEIHSSLTSSAVVARSTSALEVAVS